MKARNTLLALALVAGMTSVANAVNQVWWEATAVTPSASVLQQGSTTPQGVFGMTQTLELECDGAIAGRCEWDVVMRVRNEEDLYGWATDLSTPDLTVSVKSFSYGEKKTAVKAGFTYQPLSVVNPAATAGAGPLLLQNTSAFSAVAAQEYYNSPNDINTDFPGFGVAWEFLFFRLSKDKAAGFVLGTTSIFGTTGATEWGTAGGSTFVTQVAGSAPGTIDVGLDGTAYGAVITIENVPEPATIAMLGFGAFCLLRRRR